jgi:hypothetical protein
MKTLKDTKQEITQRYLNQYGIHGVGMDSRRKTVMIYASADKADERKAVLKQIEETARPYAVRIVLEEEPEMTFVL